MIDICCPNCESISIYVDNNIAEYSDHSAYAVIQINETIHCQECNYKGELFSVTADLSNKGNS